MNLFGSVADEGLPRGGTLTVAWQKLSGPGTVTFTPPQTARTRATFSAPGTYELELSANDAELTSRARINVTVLEAAAAQVGICGAAESEQLELRGALAVHPVDSRASGAAQP